MKGFEYILDELEVHLAQHLPHVFFQIQGTYLLRGQLREILPKALVAQPSELRDPLVEHLICHHLRRCLLLSLLRVIH